MLYKIRCRPAFAALFVTLVPGESITTKTGCIVSMDKGIILKTQFAGGLLSAIIRKVFGPQLFLVDRVSNRTDDALTVVLGHSNLGDIERINLSQSSICLQPDVYLAHTSGVTIKERDGYLLLLMAVLLKKWFMKTLSCLKDSSLPIVPHYG